MMIRYQEMVPDYYIEKSRDFQVLCRMYDFAMNSLKYNIDSMQTLTDTRNIKDTVLPLLGDKLGIYDKEAYANRQLLDALPIAIKYKGALKSVKILLNAFLDSMDIFTEAVALYARTQEEADEISAILDRPIQPYSIIIILSAFPNLTNLHVLEEYLNMVIPTGMIVEYGFGIQKVYLDKFKYKEYMFLLYTGTRTYEIEPITVPMTGMVKNKSEKYAPTFTYFSTGNVRGRMEMVGRAEATPLTDVTHTLRYTAVANPPATSVDVFRIDVDTITGQESEPIPLVYEPSGTYTNITIPKNTITYIKYYYDKNVEFINKLNEEGFDVNAIGIGEVMSKEEFKSNE